MNQTSSSSNTSLPSDGAPRWISNGRGRIWYPVLVVLILLLLSFLFYYIRRILSQKEMRINDDSDGSSGSDSSSTVGILLPLTRPRLHPDVVSPRSIFVYSAAGDERLECAVCLAEFRDEEKGRQLPRCGHRFHAACVDVWFRSHTTCPICRSSIELTTMTAAPAAEPEEAV